MEQTQDRICECLGSDYTNVRYLNAGGMGTLYRAYKQGLGVDVVVKKVKSELKGRMDETREANILKRLKHHYLPRIYDIIHGADGYSYTVMDYIPGCNLQEYVRSHGALSGRQAYQWACQLAEAVTYLHAQQPPILHCDIKPSNIMITPQNDICLIDFNTSLIFSEGMMAVGATPGYAAPEQYTRRITGPGGTTFGWTQAAAGLSFSVAQTTSAGEFGGIGVRTDVYGIGATMYFMLTGYAPAHALQQITPLDAYDLHISEALRTIVIKAMSRQPGERFQTAAELYDTLKNIRTLDRGYRRYLAQRRTAAVLLTLGFAASVACTCYGVFVMRRESDTYYIGLVDQGLSLSSAGSYEESYDALTQAIRLFPRRIDAYNGMAVLLYRESRYDECIELIQSQVYDAGIGDSGASRQVCANVAYILASCYFEKGEYAAAAEQYESALYYEPDSAEYLRELAVAQASAGSLDAARATLEKLSAVATDQTDVLLVQGEIASASGQPEQAVSCFEQVIAQSSDPQTLSRAYALADQAYRKLSADRVDEEIAMLEQACSTLGSPANLPQMEDLAAAYARKAQADTANAQSWYQKALDCYTNLENIGITGEEVRLNEALMLEYLGRFDESEQKLNALCADFAEDYRPWMRLAFLYADRQEDLPSGQRSYRQVSDCWQKAAELYAAAQNSGVQDSEMERLNAMMTQLKTAGWL